MTAYYNEYDPFAAAWLRELIAAGLIAPGEVDERSIEDVTPDDLRSFQQCHFFAGIGVWSLAARLVGIPDDAPLWSGSCPCQPFSAAGKGGGFADERHLWPAFHFLIEQCRPAIIVGEQVAGRNGDTWLDLVSADMEATGYAFGAVETVACGFGAPHKRSRNYWAGVTADKQRERTGIARRWRDGPTDNDSIVALADRLRDGRREGWHINGTDDRNVSYAIGGVQPVRMANADGGNARDGDIQPSREHGLIAANRRFGWRADSGAQSEPAQRMERPGPVNGFWRDADWLRCRDEKWRPVEPGTFPLADAGAFRNRVGLLRGAGNAITIGQAVGWFEAVKAVI